MQIQKKRYCIFCSLSTQTNDMIAKCAEYFHNLRIVLNQMFCLLVHPPYYISMFLASLTKFTFTLLKVEKDNNLFSSECFHLHANELKNTSHFFFNLGYVRSSQFLNISTFSEKGLWYTYLLHVRVFKVFLETFVAYFVYISASRPLTLRRLSDAES